MRRVYDYPNPYAPDIRPKRKTQEDDKKTLKRFKKHFVSLSAFERHQQLINNYQLYYPGSTKTLVRDDSKDRGVMDVVKDNHRFLWGSEDLSQMAKNWDMQLAKRYYDKLFKEYCVADLRHFERNKIGMRWRTEGEVKRGKGQFVCGATNCTTKKQLSTWEVNFSYREHGETKNALVKLRLCKACSLKLNFHSQKRRIKKEVKSEEDAHTRHHKHKKHKRRRRHSSSASSTVSGDDETRNAPSTSAGTSTTNYAAEDSKVGTKAVRALSQFAAEVEKRAKEASEIWSKPLDVPDEETQQHDDIDSFLDDLFM